MPWLMSGLTILLTVLAGNKHRHTWVTGILSQSVWLAWICLTGEWGFLPMSGFLIVLYARNHLKWNAANTKT
ncbi:MAG: hypothetical protein JXR13_18670 [Thalassovita sp.]